MMIFRNPHMISDDIKIDCKDFKIGNYAHIGPNVKIKGNSIHIGNHFYCSGGLTIGGGGSSGPRADLTIGDRCTLHNNFINLCEPVYIGHDVGFSHNVSIITHGYWMNVFKGYPRKFAGVRIYDKVILGYNTIVLPGCSIDEGTVVGAGSVVTKPIGRGVWAGNPARFIRDIREPSLEEREEIFKRMVYDWSERTQGMEFEADYMYPIMAVNGLEINVETQEYYGEEDEVTDLLRDFLRHYGVRIYTERGF